MHTRESIHYVSNLPRLTPSSMEKGDLLYLLQELRLYFIMSKVPRKRHDHKIIRVVQSSWRRTRVEAWFNVMEQFNDIRGCAKWVRELII